jgi:hypothetical protein
LIKGAALAGVAPPITPRHTATETPRSHREEVRTSHLVSDGPSPARTAHHPIPTRRVRDLTRRKRAIVTREGRPERAATLEAVGGSDVRVVQATEIVNDLVEAGVRAA